MAILPRVDSLVERGGDVVASAFFGEGPDIEPANAERAAGEACDAASLEALYGELAPHVHRFLRDLLGDATLASDATQETFIRAFRRVGELPPETRLAPWVFGIARNVSLELRRARGRLRRVVAATAPANHANIPDRCARTPEAELLDREAVEVVTRALDALSEERRSVLLLRLDHGLAYEDIGQLMGWSLAKVKVEIFRAREVLREAFLVYRGGEP